MTITSRTLRVAALGTTAALLSLFTSGAASATVKPAYTVDECGKVFTFKGLTTVLMPGPNTVYSLDLSNGTFEARFSNDWLDLTEAYIKTGGSQITADFQYYFTEDGAVCVGPINDDGAFTESAGQSRSFSWDNDLDFSDNPDIYAVISVAGQGLFGIHFEETDQSN